MLLGVDGGGTKTIFALCDETGHILAMLDEDALVSDQVEGIRKVLRRGVDRVLADLGAEVKDIKAACLGIPCWGENAFQDQLSRTSAEEILTNVPAYLCNDCEVAWAGSLGMQPGINVVVGTGMIAFGRNVLGATARSGGWSEIFSDEGSGYWLGKKMLEIFSKEADGRIPKGALYTLVRGALSLERDFDIIPMAHEEILPFRDKTAALQRLLLQAALAGDPAAIECYCQAAAEIALAVLAVYDALDFESPPPVSYSGGIFKTGEVLLTPFIQALRDEGMAVSPPKAPPWAGALLIAANTAGCLDQNFRKILVSHSFLPGQQEPV